MEFDKKVIVDVDGFIENGKQFDLDLRLPESERNVVYGIVKDHHGEPVKDAVVKLVEVCKDERKPVSHTFTDKEGEFVFGPLCPNKSYAIQIWVNQVKHVKICKVCEHEGKCLKGVDLCCEREPRMNYRDYDRKDYYEKDYDKKYYVEKDYDKKDFDKKYYDEKDYDKKGDYKKEYDEKDYDKKDDYKKEYDEKEHDKKDDYKKEYDKKDDYKKEYDEKDDYKKEYDEKDHDKKDECKK